MPDDPKGPITHDPDIPGRVDPNRVDPNQRTEEPTADEAPTAPPDEEADGTTPEAKEPEETNEE